MLWEFNKNATEMTKIIVFMTKVSSLMIMILRVQTNNYETLFESIAII